MKNIIHGYYQNGIFYDAVAANAIMDRILHHAHVVPISGKYLRTEEQPMREKKASFCTEADGTPTAENKIKETEVVSNKL